MNGIGEILRKQPRAKKMIGKLLDSIFSYARGIIFIDYIEKGKTVTCDYYVTLLGRVNNEIVKIGMQRTKFFFLLPGNCPALATMIVMAK